MPKDPVETAGAQGPGVSRRRFMKGAAALAAAAALPSTPGIAGASVDQGAAIPVRLPARPNIVLLITDQERSPQHWPDG